MSVQLDSSRVQFVLVGTVAVASAVLLLATTHRWGLGVSYDSVVYVQASHSLSEIPLPQPRDHGGEALYWWAPAYPVLLRAFGGDYSGGRLLNALLLALGAVLVGAVSWRLIGRDTAAVASGLYAFSPAAYDAHLNLLAEPMFLLLATTALGLIAAGRGTLAGGVTATAVLTRYAALPLLVVGALFLRGRERVKFIGVGVACYGGWLIRNEVVAGQATGRQAQWHPLSLRASAHELHALVEVLVTPGRLPSLRYAHAGLVVQLAVAAAVIFAFVRMHARTPPRIVTIGLAYVLVYSVFLIATASLFDAATPVDERLLVPAVPPLVLAVSWIVRAQPLVALIPICAFILATAQESRTVSLYGLDYSGQIWSSSRFDGASLPRGTLYSNWPAAVAYFAGRSPRRLPSRVDPHTLAPNLRYDQEWAQLTRSVRQGHAALVVFDNGFLQIAPSGIPIWQQPDFRKRCRALNEIVHVCSGGVGGLGR
jgi:hypothetical protein